MTNGVEKRLAACVMRLRGAVRSLPDVFASRGLPLRATDRRLAKLRGRYAGRRCFILGNGPSLKQHDLSLLRDECVFATNWFVLHREFPNLTNLLYCISDPHLWNHGEGFHPELVEALSSNRSAQLFLESSGRVPARRAGLELTYRPFFIRLNDSEPVWKGHFSTDVSRGTNWGHTVVIDICLPLAYHLGFTDVYLLGCDCDYRLSSQLDYTQSFFYDVSRVPERDLKHLREQQRGAQAQEQLEKWTASYQVVREAFERDGRRVFNAGHGGKLEVFPRVRYDHLFPAAASERGA